MSSSMFRQRAVVVEAVQVTDATFDLPHPNPEHVAGVLYDPLARCAYVTADGRLLLRADVGDWIITDATGALNVVNQHLFLRAFEPVEGTSAASDDAPPPAPEPVRMFPIQGGPDIPWSIIGIFAKQVQRNHGQTLERLAERGGLGVKEALCALRCVGLSSREPESIAIFALSQRDAILALRDGVAALDPRDATAARLRAEVARWQRGFRYYGEHDLACPRRAAIGNDCTCGYSALVREASALAAGAGAPQP
jgi:hypothetical protein